MTNQGGNVREMALSALMEINERDAFSNVVVKRILDANTELSKADRAFFTRLCEGSCERMITLDYVIDSFSNVKVKKMKPAIRNIMRMSVYQILYMERVPDSAVCNEAVKLAAKRGFHNLKGFVNGVLRNISRNKDSLKLPSKQEEPLSFLSVAYSCPEWIVQEWLDEYGFDVTEGILKGQLRTKPLSARMIAPETGSDVKQEKKPRLIRSEVLQSLEEQGIHSYANPLVPDGILIEKLDRPDMIKEFQNGSLYIQDTSSILAMQCAGIRRGDTCIDVCAAPGGKTVYASTACGGNGLVLARDLSDGKTDLIRQNVKRLHLKNVTVQTWDATKYDAACKEKADVVIADLPCSGLGVMGRKSDIKYKTQPSDLAELAKLQRQILQTVCDYVKPGGILLYSTCTIHPAENVDNMRFLEQRGGFSLESVEEFLPEALKSVPTAREGYVQLLPNGEPYYDGFFFARFRKDK